MDSIDRAGPARLRTNELPRQKSPEVCARQRADRAPRVSTAQKADGRHRRRNTRGTSAAGGRLLDRAPPLALRPASERLAQRQFDANASQRNRAHDAVRRDARTRVVFAARGFVSLPEGLATAGT